DFPFGSWRASGGMEPFMRWASDQAPWIKITVGGVAMAGAVVATGAVAAHGNPYAFVMGAGAIAGGVQGGIEASLSGGDFSDVMLTAGVGAAFGAAVPWGAFGALAGSAGSSFTAWAAGGNPKQIATAYQWGGLAGGIGGDFTGAARTAVKFGARRALQHGLVQVGPDLLGGGAGAIIGYHVDGTSTSALHGATLGMMAGGISGGLARGLPGVRRGVESGTIAPATGRGLIGFIKPSQNYDPSLRTAYEEIVNSTAFARDLAKYNQLARKYGQTESATAEQILEVLRSDTAFARTWNLRAGLFVGGEHSAAQRFVIQGNPLSIYGPRAARHELVHLGASIRGQADVFAHEILVQRATTPEVLYGAATGIGTVGAGLGAGLAYGIRWSINQVWSE
ncbi:MAG: hypothetical protein WD049_00455, partial [Candidatus Paceibacterota bacterium]